MLPRRRDLLKSDKQASTTSSSSTSSLSSKQNKTSTTNEPLEGSTRGEKRKSADSRHDGGGGEGSEYLRRKHNFIRSTVRFDYQPDICKDYKETGFCGFGDSCKFLHDRLDYKHGWQIEQEWAKECQTKDEVKKDPAENVAKDDDQKGENENICPICREKFKDPIVTKCKHHFCGTCAEKECSSKCFVCEKSTSGIFKVAKIETKTASDKSQSKSSSRSPDITSEREEKSKIDHDYDSESG